MAKTKHMPFARFADSLEARDPSPRVSVVIRTYNRAGLLARAVDSVLAQTFADFEILIVDDGSADDTPQAVAAFSDPRIRGVRHAHNQGPVSAANTGLAQARGEYAAFLDDDDIWLPSKLERQVAVLDASSPVVAWVYGWRDLVDTTERRVLRSVRKTMEGDILDYALALDCPGPPSTWLVRTSVLRELGGLRVPPRTRSPASADVDLIRRLCMHGYHVAVVREVITRKRIHADQMTGESMANLDRRAAFYRAHLAEFSAELSARPAALASVMFRLAWIEFRRGDFRAVVRLTLSALRRSPLTVLGLVVGKRWFLRKMVHRLFGGRPLP